MAEVTIAVTDCDRTTVVTARRVTLETSELGISSATTFAVGFGHYGAGSLETLGVNCGDASVVTRGCDTFVSYL